MGLLNLTFLTAHIHLRRAAFNCGILCIRLCNFSLYCATTTSGWGKYWLPNNDWRAEIVSTEMTHGSHDRTASTKNLSVELDRNYVQVAIAVSRHSSSCCDLIAGLMWIVMWIVTVQHFEPNKHGKSDCRKTLKFVSFGDWASSQPSSWVATRLQRIALRQLTSYQPLLSGARTI